MNRFQNILAVCDEDSAYEHAFERTSWLARKNGAQVTLVATVDTKPGELGRLLGELPGRKAAQIEAAVLSVHQARLEGIAAPLRDEGLQVTTKILQGTPFIEIIREVLRTGHDLVIKGIQRSPSGPFFRGPDMHLMRKCPCPVWVLNPATSARSERILAAVDPDPSDAGRDELNSKILQLSTALARQDNAKLDVMSVWRLQEEATLRNPLAEVPAEHVDALAQSEEAAGKERLISLTARFAEFMDLMRPLHVKGIAEDFIPEHVAAEGIDTIVMGTLARTGVAGLFIGNTAETILNRVQCSVLTVKAQGFVSPVTLEEHT